MNKTRLFDHTAKHAWNRRSKMLFLENIEMYISAGLTMYDALNTTMRIATDAQKKSLGTILRHIEQGRLVSYALDMCIGFPPAIIGLIEHGERSGNVARSIGLARTILERQDALIRSCMSAMAYPVAIGAFACALTIGLMRGVMPQITPLLKSLHQSLPLLTRIMMNISDNIVTYGLWMCLSGISVGSLIFILYRRVPICTRWFQAFFLSIPIVGMLLRSYIVSVAVRSLGSLIESSIGVAAAYAMVVQRIDVIPIKNQFLIECGSVTRGVPLARSLSTIKHMPPHVVPLISAGEASGSLGESLIRSADIIDRDMEHRLKKLTALIEPIMMIGIGIIVGSIAVSIIMPIYDISKNLQHA
jgi:type II secretory pathway component PulF